MTEKQPSTWYNAPNAVQRRYTTDCGITVYVDSAGNQYPSVPTITSRIDHWNSKERLIDPIIHEQYGEATVSDRCDVDPSHLFWFSRQVGRLAHHQIASQYRDIGSYELTLAERELTELNESEVREDTHDDIVYSVAASRGWVTGRDDPAFEVISTDGALLRQAREDVRKIRRNWELASSELGITQETVQAVEWMGVHPLPNEHGTQSAGFGGQIDLIYERDGKHKTVDLKTSEWFYAKYVMQALAYRHLCPLSAETQVIRLGRERGDYAVFSSTSDDWPDSQRIWSRFKAEAILVSELVNGTRWD
ncbi:PD-(D/E)XK nuclease family protein [Natronosalvus vescus]|uniref:PD-(D/E)XK nuclease family protein n=1 Tax=Natronosalvus vescus TaxID=2953881 RepID=UPI002090CE2A|nr:PD-(D/E)XK nuclease family protein [Natronosalvus vescus]